MCQSFAAIAGTSKNNPVIEQGGEMAEWLKALVC
jgi:hypothetical protein